MARAFENMLKGNPGRSLDNVLKSAALKCPPGKDELMNIIGTKKCSKEAGEKSTSLPDKSVNRAGNY
jgi:hypothetical protein